MFFHALIAVSLARVAVATKNNPTPAHYGFYVGVQPEVATSGGDDTTSAVSIELDQLGLQLGVGLNAEGQPWRIRYPWTVMKTDARDGVLRVRVRQNEKSHEDAFVLLFRTPKRVRMEDARGTLRGDLVRVEKFASEKQIADVRRIIHSRHYQDWPFEGLNAAADLMHRGSDANPEKTRWVAHVREVIREMPESHLRRIVPLVTMALGESDTELIRTGLKALARLPRAEAVGPLVRLALREGLNAENARELASTLGLYLHQARLIEKARAGLRDRFGTDDLLMVHDRLKGVIDIDDKVARKAPWLDQPHSRAWSGGDILSLRAAIVHIAENGPGEGAREAARRARATWDHALCDEFLNGSPL